MSPEREMRLPGSVAEVAGSPEGPHIGAFFDLDGTLVAGFTAVILTREQLLSRQLGVGDFIGMIHAGLNHQLGRSEFIDLITAASRAMRGRSLSDLDEMGERLFRQKIESRIYPEMREVVRAHMLRGHTVCLSSSALTIQVEPVARFLGITNLLTNRLDVDDDGVLTGDVVKPILWGPGKANAVQQFAAEHDIDLRQSYFYADGDEDVALMYLVGNPRPTNPEGKMAAVARQRGWPITRFTSRSGTGLTAAARAIAGAGSMLPVAAGAVGWGLLTRNRRRGINFFSSNWGPLLLSISGVKVNVLGRENLTAQRPAVFLFNHRNNFDPVITSTLVRENFTGVGKKELESDPLVGTLGKLMDAVFIDREDAKSAVEELHKVEALARKGISVVIAPEGTRLDTTEVGSFKKGPFRIAMSAGIPIVPVVIRNAQVIASRNSTTMNPGTVDVAVFPPISVADWTADDLAERIAGIRQLYLDTLRNWPIDELPDVTPYLVPAVGGASPPAEAMPNPTPAKTPAKKAPAKDAPARKAKKATPEKSAAEKAVPAKAPVARKASAKAPAKKASGEIPPEAPGDGS
jgi:putative phosphoserine phosphatase / 1-acylglycerol-3-phosphate O-acyltransferase